MALEKITEKPTVSTVNENSYFFITQLEKSEDGNLVATLKRASLSALIPALRASGAVEAAGLKSVGKYSEIFNDYINNIAGIKGYYWSNIDFTGVNPVITFSSTQGIADSQPFQIDYEVGDVISIVNNGHWTDCSTILDIKDNLVTVDVLPFDKISVPSPVTHDDYSVFVIKKPLVGIIDLGQFAHAEGENTACYERSGHSEGRDTVVTGQYGHAQNRECIADYCAFAGGQKSQAIGKHSFAFGKAAKALFDGAVAIGNAVIASFAGQFVFGKYNILDSAGLYSYIFGNGKSDAKRSNAHTIDWNGNAWFSGHIKIGGTSQEDSMAKEVATVESVESTIKDYMAGTFATFKAAPLVAGITSELSIKLLYDVDADSFDLMVNDVMLESKTPINKTMRIATELLNAENTLVVFYSGDDIVYKCRIMRTITNFGMLFTI